MPSSSPEKHTSEDISSPPIGSSSSPMSREGFHHHSPPQIPSSGQKSNYDDKMSNQERNDLHQPTGVSNFSLSGILAKPKSPENACSVPTDLSMMVKTCPCPEGDYQTEAGMMDRNRSDDNSEDDSDAEIDLTSHGGKDDVRQNHYMNGGGSESGPILNDMVPNDLSMHCNKNNIH